uniref:hypothetical protein n=1 Tax=Mesosutterella multiformis TaxID=2259133 RepID=UPI0040265AA7
LWATILFSGFALEVIIRQRKRGEISAWRTELEIFRISARPNRWGIRGRYNRHWNNKSRQVK